MFFIFTLFAFACCSRSPQEYSGVNLRHTSVSSMACFTWWSQMIQLIHINRDAALSCVLFICLLQERQMTCQRSEFYFLLLSYFLLSIEDVPYISNIMNNHKYSKNYKINIHEILHAFKLILFLLIKSFTRFPQLLHQIFPNSILIYQITSIKCLW